VLLSGLVFNCCFDDTNISQGSATTHLRCGGIFSNSAITNFLLILTVKEFRQETPAVAREDALQRIQFLSQYRQG